MKQNKATSRLLLKEDILVSEKERLDKLLLFENGLKSQGLQQIAGIDEAGRGPLAGPVVAAACVFSENLFIPNINDSKKLSESKRNQVFEKLTTCNAVSYGIGIVDSKEIDRINILEATKIAMKTAIENLKKTPDYLLIDGMGLPGHKIPHEKVIGGDAKCYSIAAASILAKVTRDRLMLFYHEKWPNYGFNQHKGYGTQAHLEAIKKWGPCPIHRMSFAPLKFTLLAQ